MRRAGRRGAAGATRADVVAVAVTVLTLLVAGCGSPEADRVRGGEPGADLGNRDPVVEIHAGAVPYAETPCLTTLPECTGPLPVSGLSTEIREHRDGRRE